MVSTFVSVPFDLISRFIGFIRERRLDLEIFFSAGVLDSLGEGWAEDLRSLLDYGPQLTLHGPYMDLCPGAVDLKVREITNARFHQVFDVAERLRPRAIVLHSGYDRWKYDRNIDMWLDGGLAVWPEFIERARAIGTRIAIENIYEDTPENLARLMSALGGPHFGVCFDPGHFNLFSKRPLAEWLDALGPHLIELHLHDNEGGFDAHRALGDGTFDFPALFRALGGRDVIFTIEARSEADVLKSIERLHEYRYKSM